MNIDEIPQELIDILNARAGKTHRADGNAIQTLAEILTRYDEILADRHKKQQKLNMINPPVVSIINYPQDPRQSWHNHNDYYMS